MKKFVENWQRALREAYQIVKQNLTKSNESAKKWYDQRTLDLVLEGGDNVLVCNLTPCGCTGQLKSHWEDKVHVFTERTFDGPIYVVTRHDGQGRTRTLHCKLFLPCLLLEDVDTKGEILSNKYDPKRARYVSETV